MYPSGSHTALMQRLDAATVEVPEQNQSGIFTTQLLLHLMQSSCITASFFFAARGGLVPVQIAATESGVAGSSSTFAVTAFSGLPASSSASRLSAPKSLPETRGEAQHDGYSRSLHFSHTYPQHIHPRSPWAAWPWGRAPLGAAGRAARRLPVAALSARRCALRRGSAAAGGSFPVLPRAYFTPLFLRLRGNPKVEAIHPTWRAKSKRRRAARWFQAGVRLSAGQGGQGRGPAGMLAQAGGSTGGAQRALHTVAGAPLSSVPAPCPDPNTGPSPKGLKRKRKEKGRDLAVLSCLLSISVSACCTFFLPFLSSCI